MSIPEKRKEFSCLSKAPEKPWNILERLQYSSHLVWKDYKFFIFGCGILARETPTSIKAPTFHASKCGI
ncbi:unnamed protein product [Arabidopsis thaliana]|uniref:Uncharacterized protein n=1 Tax=Arabidopsis thaliana TaxID=3702 RepID=A0A5S9Y8W1_ARATH|nr:unnamed protein product [Arabidopsis thaliana]